MEKKKNNIYCYKNQIINIYKLATITISSHNTREMVPILSRDWPIFYLFCLIWVTKGPLYCCEYISKGLKETFSFLFLHLVAKNQLTEAWVMGIVYFHLFANKQCLAQVSPYHILEKRIFIINIIYTNVISH